MCSKYYEWRYKCIWYSQEFVMNPTLVDELERQLTIYNPSEYIFISNLSEERIKRCYSI